jgi:uncharacterized protein YdhG (YjbR/CyaY superfamily)
VVETSMLRSMRQPDHARNTSAGQNTPCCGRHRTASCASLAARDYWCIEVKSSKPLEKTMKTDPALPKDIDDYIARFPRDVQETLQQVRRTIRKAAPDAEETIKYQIPTFTLHGNLVHFAAYEKHIGVYPAPRGNPKFKDILSGYEGGKGTVRFPLDKPIPLDVIGKIVKFRVEENLKKAAGKKNPGR